MWCLVFTYCDAKGSTIILGLKGATFFLNCDPCILWLLVPNQTLTLKQTLDTFKAGNNLSDSNDDIMLGSASRNSQSDEFLSLFLSDSEKSDFSEESKFSAEED